MKIISTKLKITLWTSLLMSLMVFLVLSFMLSMSSSIIEVSGKGNLTDIIDDNADEIEFDDGELDLSDVNFFERGVYTLLYTVDGYIIAGKGPTDIYVQEKLQDRVITTLSINGTDYYIYDRLIYVEDYADIWIRGIIVVNEVANVVNSLLQIALFTLPFFVLLSTIGCYFISKKAFRPIEKIINAGKEISDSEDLSLRIDLGKGNDEIYQLANTFDKMFSRLEKSFEAEKQFSADVSHELRTPTAVILAQCEYALGNNATADDKQEALEVVQRQSFKMAHLISNLLNLTRLDRGIEKIDFKQINFSELITDICEDQQFISPYNITLKTDIEPNIMAYLDQAMIIQLSANLISNAFRYGKENGSVHVSLIENKTEIILSIEDDGIGISPEHQEKIWQRFYQVNPSRTAEQNGSMGLGLSMTMQIAKLHGAIISLKSELNIGSTFIVKFSK